MSGSGRKHNTPARKKRQGFRLGVRALNSTVVGRVADSLASPREPERQADERGRAAGHVEETVVDRGRARRDEGLVVFVEERDGGDEREGGEPPAAAERRARRRAEGTRGEQREHGVLCEVRGLSDDEVDLVNRKTAH